MQCISQVKFLVGNSKKEYFLPFIGGSSSPSVEWVPPPRYAPCEMAHYRHRTACWTQLPIADEMLSSRFPFLTPDFDVVIAHLMKIGQLQQAMQILTYTSITSTNFYRTPKKLCIAQKISFCFRNPRRQKVLPESSFLLIKSLKHHIVLSNRSSTQRVTWATTHPLVSSSACCSPSQNYHRQNAFSTHLFYLQNNTVARRTLVPPRPCKHTHPC